MQRLIFCRITFFFTASAENNCVCTREAELARGCVEATMAFAHQRLEVDPYGTLRSLVRCVQNTQVALLLS